MEFKRQNQYNEKAIFQIFMNNHVKFLVVYVELKLYYAFYIINFLKEQWSRDISFSLKYTLLARVDPLNLEVEQMQITKTAWSKYRKNFH